MPEVDGLKILNECLTKKIEKGSLIVEDLKVDNTKLKKKVANEDNNKKENAETQKKAEENRLKILDIIKQPEKDKFEVLEMERRRRRLDSRLKLTCKIDKNLRLRSRSFSKSKKSY